MFHVLNSHQGGFTDRTHPVYILCAMVDYGSNPSQLKCLAEGAVHTILRTEDEMRLIMPPEQDICY